MSNAAVATIQVGATYYSGNTFDPHMDRVDAVTDSQVHVTYLGRVKSGGPLAGWKLDRVVPMDRFLACYHPSYDAMLAARKDDGAGICGMLRATLPGER